MLQELQTLTTRLDSQLRGRALELKGDNQGVRNPSSAPLRTATPVRPSTVTPAIAPLAARPANQTPQASTRPLVMPPTPAADGTTLMELDNLRVGKLTPTEKEKCLQEGRCFRCRQPGHVGASCPYYAMTAGIEINLTENDEGRE